MTRTTLISLCFLFIGIYGCRIPKSNTAYDDSKNVKTKPDTTKVVISPPLIASRKVDTLLFQATNQSVMVVGKQNLNGNSQGRLQVNIPVTLKALSSEREDSLISIAYWVGVGETPILAYEKMEEEVPLEWSQPGISAPLAAYIQGYPVPLYSSADYSQQNRIRFDFIDSQESDSFAKSEGISPLISRDPNQPNFGIVTGTELQKLHRTISQDLETGKKAFRINLAYANQHRINSYMLQLKVVALYEVEQ